MGEQKQECQYCECIVEEKLSLIEVKPNGNSSGSKGCSDSKKDPVDGEKLILEDVIMRPKLHSRRSVLG
jgi:hypothetical protein